MSYNKLFSLIQENNEIKSFILNMSSGVFDIPYLMKETLNILDDCNPMLNMIPDNNKIALSSMINQYFDSCYTYFIDNNNLESVLEYGKIEIYKVDAANGLRAATVHEIEQGIESLISEYIYPAGEKEFKLLSLLCWTFTGKSYLFRKAGYNLEYENKKVKTTFYEMIKMCAYDLKELFSWLETDDNFNNAINKIKKLKKSKGYKYATYEKDEITEYISIKQLICNVEKIFPRSSTNRDYRRGLALALSSSKGNKKLSPSEVSELRKIYHKYLIDNNNKNSENKTDESLKNKCESILSKRYSGEINPDHFAFKIITTLKSNKYTKVSPKQMAYIDDAFYIINSTNKTNEVETKILSDDEVDNSLTSLSNAIGKGLFEDMD